MVMLPYDRLLHEIREINDLAMAGAVLGWDRETFMPPQANGTRTRVLTTMAALVHSRLVDPRLGDLLAEAEARSGLDDTQRAQLREIRRERDRATKIPERLVRAIEECAGAAQMAWVDARRRSDFPSFAPHLAQLVALKREMAQALGFPEGGSPYDALIDLHEPGETVASLDLVLSRTRDICATAFGAIREAQARAGGGEGNTILKREYDLAAQERLGEELMRELGLRPEFSRLDKSVHPFSTSFGVNDIRITARYERNWLPCAIFAVLHETGHGLYEAGLPPEHEGTPLGQSVSLGIHESQSRFWENQVGRSRAYWRRRFAPLKALFPAALADVDETRFFRAVNHVEPSFIRIEADEVSYNFHILIRWEAEKALFLDKLPVVELPALWNDLSRKYLGITPPDDAQGVLQDMHWAHGEFGYFATYLLGNLYAAQWRAAMRRDVGDVDALVAAGDFAPILGWLRTHIHRHGRRYTAAELCRHATGESLNPAHFDAYLKERFGEVYDTSW